MAEKKQAVAIIGAGISGLIACKFVAQKGFHPVVYEAEDGIGGVWARTINSTKLQNHKSTYEFCDFPWPSSVETDYPSHKQVLDYLHSYALHFDLLRFINFNSRVLGIDYDADANGEDTASYSSQLWGGTGLPFAKEPRWILEVQNTKNNTVQVLFFFFFFRNFKFSGDLPRFILPLYIGSSYIWMCRVAPTFLHLTPITHKKKKKKLYIKKKERSERVR